ncbi:MAG: hypothetical protein QM767_18010 [Anaeromyxobacter sp.]
MADSRAGFITHAGRRIYLINAEGLTSQQVIDLCPTVERDIRSQPPASVMTITHVKGVPLDHKMTERLRQLSEGNKPFVRCACITGLSPVQRFVFNTVKVLARRDFHVFETVDQAKDFLSTQP